MHQVPALFRAHPIAPGRHWRAVQPGHENPIEVRVRRATLESGTAGEIMWRYKIALVVPKRGRGGAITLPALAVTLITFQCLLVELLAAHPGFRRIGSFRRNRDGFFRFFLLKTM